MDQLIELNLSILNNLSFKYKALKLFKEHNLKTTEFSIDFIQGDFSNMLNFSHNLLETYLEFKDALQGKVMPNTPRICTDHFDFFEFLDDSNLHWHLYSALDFEIIEVYKTIFYDDFDTQEKLKKCLCDFADSNFFDSELFEIHEHVNFNQTVITHPLIDDLFEKNDTLKIDKLLSFLNLDYNSSSLANFFLPISYNSYYDTFISITTTEKLGNSQFIDANHLPSFKYAILINSFQVPDWHNDYEFSNTISTFLEFYQLLSKE